MNILVNALPLMGLLTGMARYLRCLYREMQEIETASIAYFNGRKAIEKMPEQAEPGLWSRRTATLWSLPDPAIVGLQAAGWLMYEWRLRNASRRAPYDVYHETTFFPAAIKDVPVVYTLHDLSLIKFRDKHPRERVWYFDLFFKRRLPYASHIITVSDFIRSEIIEELKIPQQMITTVHEAPDPGFSPRSEAELSETLRRHGLPREYILFVGTLDPRKNLPLLLDALSICKTDVPLVLVGWQGWGDEEVWRGIEGLGLSRRVFVTGYVSEDTLACLFSGAVAFVYPSLYEGFGLPVLEAMACGCPVICSNAASLPEVAGDAALLIDPKSAESLAHSLDEICSDSELRDSLRTRGFARAAQFSWRETARRTLEVFQKTARESRSRD